MRAVMVVVMLPGHQFFPRILLRNELVDVQELIVRSTVEWLAAGAYATGFIEPLDAEQAFDEGVGSANAHCPAYTRAFIR